MLQSRGCRVGHDWAAEQRQLVDGLPWWRSSEESAAKKGDVGSIPGSGRFPGEGNGNALQYSCLENPMDRGAWQATVQGVTKSYNWATDDTHTIEIYQHHIIFVICISLMTNDVEYLCMSLLVLHKHKCSFMKCLHEFSGPFFIGLSEFVWRKGKCLR